MLSYLISGEKQGEEKCKYSQRCNKFISTLCFTSSFVSSDGKKIVSGKAIERSVYEQNKKMFDEKMKCCEKMFGEIKHKRSFYRSLMELIIEFSAEINLKWNSRYSITDGTTTCAHVKVNHH